MGFGGPVSREVGFARDVLNGDIRALGKQVLENGKKVSLLPWMRLVISEDFHQGKAVRFKQNSMVLMPPLDKVLKSSDHGKDLCLKRRSSQDRTGFGG